MSSIGSNSWMIKQILGISSFLFTSLSQAKPRAGGGNGHLALTHLPELGSYHGGTAVKHKYHILG